MGATAEPGPLRYEAMSNRRPSLLRTASRLLEDLLAFVRFGLMYRAHLAAETLFLRKQLALYQERPTKPRRPDPATRVALVLLSRWLDWRSMLTVGQPDTLIRWHRQGRRLFSRWKSRAGRPPIPVDVQRLIIAMARANPTWGEERIADELLLKLGLTVSPRTLGRYLQRLRPSRGGRPAQRWATFVRNHAHAVLACDFFTTITVGFPRPLGVRRARRRHAPDRPLERDRASDGGLDDPTVSDRDHRRNRASCPGARPRCDLRPSR